LTCVHKFDIMALCSEHGGQGAPTDQLALAPMGGNECHSGEGEHGVEGRAHWLR
jgi:hypothetical protein